MPTPYKRLKKSELSFLMITTLGNLKPYQIRQVQEALDRINWGPKGSDSDISAQPALSSIISALNNNDP